MTTCVRPFLTALAFIAVQGLMDVAVMAQTRTDVVTLANGDRITGEIVHLDRGQLEFKTDDIGTLYLEWDKLVSLVTTRLVEVTTTDGQMFLGSLGRTADRAIAVTSADATAQLAMPDVTEISTIGRSFWRKLDGSFDVGFSYTRSSGIAQLNLNTDTHAGRRDRSRVWPSRGPRRSSATKRDVTIAERSTSHTCAIRGGAGSSPPWAGSKRMKASDSSCGRRWAARSGRVSSTAIAQS